MGCGIGDDRAADRHQIDTLRDGDQGDAAGPDSAGPRLHLLDQPARQMLGDLQRAAVGSFQKTPERLALQPQQTAVAQGDHLRWPPYAGNDADLAKDFARSDRREFDSTGDRGSLRHSVLQRTAQTAVAHEIRVGVAVAAVQRVAAAQFDPFHAVQQQRQLVRRHVAENVQVLQP